MKKPFRKRSGSRAAALASTLLLSLTGCLYSFTGGGLPGHIDTVAVLPFDNDSGQPLLDSDIQQALQAELPRNLGVRLAPEDAADAWVQGRVVAYEETAPSIRPSQGRNEVDVLTRQVRIVYEAEIIDVREDRPLWRVASQTVLGNFEPDRETVSEGKARAIQELVRKVIEGAQSQW